MIPALSCKTLLEEPHIELLRKRLTRDVSKGASNSVVLIINEARAEFHDPSTIPHLSFAGPKSL